MARWTSNSPYVNIDFNVSNIYLHGDWPNMHFHFDCNFNYYCPSGYASMNYNGVNFHTDVYGSTETKTENVNFSITAGQISPHYGANYYNPGMGNSRQVTVNVHAWISNGLYTGGGWTTVTSPTVENPSNLSLRISNVTETSCVVNHSFTNVHNYWFVRLWDRNTRTYYNLNNNNGNGTTTITGLKPNTEYKFELWACGRDGSEYYGAYPAQTITTLGKSRIANTPAYMIGGNFAVDINGFSDTFTHRLTCSVGAFSFTRSGLKRGVNTIIPTTSENASIYAQMKASASKPMSFLLETFMNGTSIGSVTAAGKVQINPAICSPDITQFKYKDVNPVSISLTGNDQYIIQNVSKIQIFNIAATAKNHAEISTYRLDVSGSTYESTVQPLQTGYITMLSSLSCKVIDSRGLQSVLEKNYALYLPYNPPIIQNFTATRKNHIETSAILTLQAAFSLITIEGVHKNSILSLKYRFKETSSSNWSEAFSLTPKIQDDKISFHNIIGDFDVDKSYHIEIQVTDKINTTTLQATLVVGKPAFSIRKKAIGINKVPDIDKALDVEGAIHSDTGFYENENYLQPMSVVNGYWGFPKIKDYIRTPQSGLLPYQSGGSGYVGTAGWPFNHGFFKNLYKDGVAVPNSNEIPIYTIGDGWHVFRFPSGMMMQTRRYDVTIPVVNDYNGKGYYGWIPAPPNYPIAFTEIISCFANADDNDVIGIITYKPSTVNFSGNGNFYAYSFGTYTRKVSVFCIAIGRWK